GAQRAGGGVARGKQRDIGGELMARDAVESRLLSHLAELDLHVLVTARLAAGLVDRHEAMHLEAVAGGALDIAQRARVGLEMDAMARGRRDAFPLLFFLVALDVARGADPRGHLRMHADFLGPVGDPEVELPRAREDRLLVTVV